MKKIKEYVLIFMLALLGIFVVNGNVVCAEETGDESDPTENYVVVNPDSKGEPSNVYEVVISGEGENQVTQSKQYTNSRNLVIKINFPSTEVLKYDDQFAVCEVIATANSTKERCANYLISEEVAHFQLTSKNDGEKEVNITFKGVKFDSNNHYPDLVLNKKIVLDTIGPVIDLTGGEYIFIPLGKNYEEQGATCTDDSGVVLKSCTVEYKQPNIDMKSETYQYIRYSAKDFLDNETIVVRKVLVEQEKEVEKKDYSVWIYSGIGVAILSAFLFIQVWKNKEKQKNQSVL